MTHTTAALLAGGMILAAGRAHAGEISTTMRVRSEDATIARLIAQATEESATFRREIETINGTDGLVYVDAGRCGAGIHGCLMHSVELAGSYRLLRVKLDVQRSERRAMATLGHELQHALEILTAVPRVKSNVGILTLYQQLGWMTGRRFETAEALQAGVEVERELTSTGRMRTVATR